MICVYICMAYIFTWHIYIYTHTCGERIGKQFKNKPLNFKVTKGFV